MRLWSIHPRYLDKAGLTGLWREGLLAQAVLLGKTKGYKNHSQLVRFKQCAEPIAAISHYLDQVYDEAQYGRNYSFDSTKIVVADKKAPFIFVTKGQVAYELKHLENKLKIRNPDRLVELPQTITQECLHPLFKLVEGPVESWEKISL